MPFKEQGPAAAVTTAATTVLGTISLGAAYGKVLGYRARNWASSAKAAAGTDALSRLKLTDANGLVFYLDAADVDYKTAEINRAISPDDTATGITGPLLVDSTGAAVAAGAGTNPVLRSPITVTILQADTATDYMEVYLRTEV